MRYLRTALIAAVLTVAFVVPSNASAQITTFQIGTSAQLGPEGITVAVPVILHCDDGFRGNVFVEVGQATGKRVNRGSGNLVDVDCTGEDQMLSVTVPTGEFPYKQGRASASGFVFVHDPITGVSTVASVAPQEIRIQK